MALVSKEELLARRTQTASGFTEEIVPIPGIGEVRVRGLSRFEAMHVQSLNNNLQREIATMAIAMMEPPMSEADIKAWMKAGGAGEFEPLAQKIQKLSGRQPGAEKQAYEDFEADPGSEFRVLPGAEAVDDNGTDRTDE